MASMSVKNRVAMFEHAGNKTDDEVNPMSPTGRSFKRPTTPTGPTFKKSTTPTGFKKPLTPTGQSFLKPTTPNAKQFDRTSVSASSPREKRASWPWPPEESVIPAPKKEHLSNNDEPRRYSSSFQSPSNAPVILPKSPKPKTSIHSSPFVLPQKSPNARLSIEPSPLKHIQNPDSNGERPKSTTNALSTPFVLPQTSPRIKPSLDLSPLKHIQNADRFPRKTSNSPLASLQQRFEPSSPTVQKIQHRASSPVAALSKSGSIDENKAPRSNDNPNTRNKAMRLAKARNGIGSTGSKFTFSGNEGKVQQSTSQEGLDNDKVNDESSADSKEVPNAVREIGSMEKDQKRESRDKVSGEGRESLDSKAPTMESPAVSEKQSSRLARVGKISQSQRRASTSSPSAEITAELPSAGSIADTKVSSESTLPVVRGTRTVSKVSHQEARKALLQAAQKKKEQVESAKQIQHIATPPEQGVLLPPGTTEKPKDLGEKNAANRLAMKAASVLAIKNSSKLPVKDLSSAKVDEAADSTDGNHECGASSNGSVVSISSDQKRRKNHPAFVARSASPRSFSLPSAETSVDKPKKVSNDSVAKQNEKPFAEELFSSIRHFRETRAQLTNLTTSVPEGTKTTGVLNSAEKAQAILFGKQSLDTVASQSAQSAEAPKALKGRPPHPQSASASPLLKSPKIPKEATPGGDTSTQVSDSLQASPMTTDHTGRLSIDSTDSPFMEQEESLHSTSERNFERKNLDGFFATGHPKYAPPRQAFPQQEGGYMSSLSSNTFSTQSMISASNEPAQIMLRLGPDTLHPLGEMSPGPSMRSGHSMAHSIISMSPRVDTSRHGSAFEYLNSPSRHSPTDFDFNENLFPAGVPPQIDEEEGSEPTFEFSIEDPSEPTVGSSIEGWLSKRNDAASNGTDNLIPIQTSYSAADAPSGFVFHDDESEGNEEDTSERPKIPDPIGMSFDDRQQYGHCEAGDEDARDYEQGSYGEGGARSDTVVKFSDENQVFDVARKPTDPSSSTKGTVSTSLRSGLSSLQNGSSGHAQTEDHVGENIQIWSPREGSKSIRSGLSGLQNPSDLEGSASMRSVSVSMKSTTAYNDLGETGPVFGNQFPLDPPQTTTLPTQPQTPGKRTNVPATIEEAEDEEASGIKFKDIQPPEPPPPPRPPQRPEGRLDPSVLGTQSTATTDASSGESGNKIRDEAEPDRMKRILPSGLNTYPEKTLEDFSIQSSPASSKHSRWKMKMPNMIKSVLAKASPRSAHTPRGESNEKNGFSTSDDDEEDIFGGLDGEAEDDLAKVMGDPPKKPTSTKSENGRTTAKRSNKRPSTPTNNKFFSSGHTRKSEPPRALDTKEPTPRRSVRSETRSTPGGRRRTPDHKLGFKGLAKRLASPMSSTTPHGNDRSGTFVEREMEHVNSDITSSILGAPFKSFALRPKTPQKELRDESEPVKGIEKAPKAKPSKAVTPMSTKSNKAKTPTADAQSIAAESKKSKESQGKDTLLDGTIFDDETKVTKGTFEPIEETATDAKSAEPKKESGAFSFMNLGCGISDALSAVASVCQFGAKDEEPEVKTVVPEEDEGGTYISADSNNSSSHLTELEKRVWNEWDKLDSAFNKQVKPVVPEKKEEHDKKREVARGKLLEIANSAISSQVTKECEQSGASISYTTSSSSDSGDTGESSGMTGSTSEGQTASTESRTYFSGSEDNETDMLSASAASKMTTTPILLSFSQRSLIEKFAKQLAHVGVEVLKLNRRKQWQVRYFTVSKEQIALIAHEANSKSGAEVAQCPKALLWLKKFNPKGGGYSLANIDKSGHGGMLLVDLKDIHVSNQQDLENPFPKKMADKFKDSVLVTLEYQFNNEKRRIEFRCKDNDEAQFLCTCMRVIRDLLKREQTLRQKTQALTPRTPSTKNKK